MNKKDVEYSDQKKGHDQYSVKETEHRVKAAVRGAFNTPPKPLKSMTPKRATTQRKPRKKA